MDARMSVLASILVGIAVAVAAGLSMWPDRAEAATVKIQVGNNWFCSPSFQGGVCPTNINVGDTVTWNFPSGAVVHTTTECGGASCDDPKPATPVWDSGVVPAGGSFSFQFNQPGTFLYQCQIHGSLMRGQITAVSPGVGGVAELPDVADARPLAGQDSSGGNVGILVAIAGAAGAGVALVGLAGAAWYTRRAPR